MRALALIAGVLMLAACGREGDPRLPSSQSDSFPSAYPAGATKSNPENIFRRAGRPE